VGTKVPKEGSWIFFYPDLKIGAIDLENNKLFIFNSPELQLGEEKSSQSLGL
jgi:hypothetical protein